MSKSKNKKKKALPTEAELVGQAAMGALCAYLAGKASGAGCHGKSGKALAKARRKEGKAQAKRGED